MKPIHIACPHCRADNRFDPSALSASGGHVVCTGCGQAFKVTPRKKSSAAPPAAADAPPTASRAPAADTAPPAPQPVEERPSATAPRKPDTLKMAAAIHAIRTQMQMQQLQAQAQQLPSAPPESGNSHRPFTILEEKAPRQPMARIGMDPTAQAVPSISIMLKPAAPALPAIPISSSLPFDLIDPEPEPKPASTHVNIQAGNLVFTLLPTPGEGGSQPLVINDAATRSEEITHAQLALASQQENLHRQFNWTLASLVALTVLIIQLFYLMSVA